MITNITGKILTIGKDNLIIEIGGVGIRVYAPSNTISTHEPAQRISLFTHLVVREDSLTLYGFDSIEARELFTLLIGVNGVGPRLALAILSFLSPEMIRAGIAGGQPGVFSRVPGVGNKTAQKILLHLEGKLESIEGLPPLAALGLEEDELFSALTSLGYSAVEAQTAIQAIPKDTPKNVENRLTAALRYFS